MMGVKRCSRCSESKLLECFRLRASRSKKPGRPAVPESWCIECMREDGRERARATSLERRRARVAKWRAENPGAAAAIRAKNAKKVAEARGIEYVPREARKEMARLAFEVRERARHVKRIARWRRHLCAMPDAERHHWRVRNNPVFVIHMRMRNSIKKALRGAKDGRRWESLVGYTREDLANHLARQMPKGFTLADIGSGRIHIDHIVPKSLFDVRNPDELMACWALTNLRPLEAKKNLRKGAKRETLL